MKQIESMSNPRIQEVRRILKRGNKKLFLLEGKKLLQEAMQSDVSIRDLFLTKAVLQKERQWIRKFENSGCTINIIDPSLLKVISDVETPAGIVAIALRPESGKWHAPKSFAALLYSVRDPGNFGTIVRSAEAAGCEFLIHTYDCVDPFQPKAVRASSGSVFRVPLFEIRNTGETLQDCRNQGVRLCALTPAGGISIFQTKPMFPAILLIGSETKGLPDDIAVDEKIRIPMSGRVESLNTGAAATIALYWLAGQIR